MRIALLKFLAYLVHPSFSGDLIKTLVKPTAVRRNEMIRVAWVNPQLAMIQVKAARCTGSQVVNISAKIGKCLAAVNAVSDANTQCKNLFVVFWIDVNQQQVPHVV